MLKACHKNLSIIVLLVFCLMRKFAIFDLEMKYYLEINTSSNLYLFNIG